MINRILIALGIRKKPEKVESEITEAYATGKLPKRTTYVGKGKLYLGGKGGMHVDDGYGNFGSMRLTATLVPPKAPIPFRKRLDPQPSVQSNDIATQLFYATQLSVTHDSPPCEPFSGKGGEFGGAGASGSWDSSCSSSSDSGSTGSGSD